MRLPNIFVITFFAVGIYFTTNAQTKVDLSKLLDSKKIQVYQRSISKGQQDKQAVKLDEKSGEGVAWLQDVQFKEGTIEIDLKGKDEFQKSFLGLAFHGVNDTTYDAIYFRPFNFHAKDSVRRIHAVQYISHPEFPWKKLRDERNGVFEKEVNPKPDPNDWFHATIHIKGGKVTVFVNHAKEPSLVVDKLNNRTGGRFGLWAGDGAGGEFANLTIVPSK